MAVICPYCAHSMNVKAARAGRFTPKCAKCGRSFQLTVTLDGETPCFQSDPLPGDTNKSASFDPNATAPPGAESSDNPDFSVAPSAVSLESTEADLSAAVATSNDDDTQMPGTLGGYQILKELGCGGMGAVYLARQVSLDRPVALKVMNPHWASNANFLVRFTREAYAAAQLVHHNVVQVYDIGEDKGVQFFSMEFVEGHSLGEIVRKEGRLPGEVAASYILQAARGLRFAHDRGMIHRDIKPDNLMLNTQGVVKVADLGLVRTPGMADEKPVSQEVAPEQPRPGGTARSLASLSNVTMAGQAMGTPSYMAPEQARDATKIDHLADIYSLGCTLYVMLTGRPLFQGSNAMEVMTKHQTDPVVRPEVVVKDVPKALSDVVVKMVAKKPEDRYSSMGEVIHALEDYMGLHGKDQQAQTEQHLRTLEGSVKAFREAPAAQLRSWVLLAFFGGCSALFLFLVLFGSWWFAGGVLGLLVLPTIAYLVVRGTMQRSHLFLKGRDAVLSSPWVELGKAALGVLLFVAVLWLCGLLGVWFLAGILGIGLALGMHYALDRKIERQRAEALEKMESLLKTLRERGLSEESLQEFVCRNAGDHWEEYFEALFGYEAKLAARTRYATGVKSRPKFAAWRDPLVRGIDRLNRRRQEARERKHLQAVEQKNLESQGVGVAEARQKAEAVADLLVGKAAEIKKEAAALQAEPTAPAGKGIPAPPPRRVLVQDLFLVADQAPKPGPSAGRRIEDGLNRLFGGSVRFIVGAVLLVVCLVWMHKNNLLPSRTNLDDKVTYLGIWERMKETSPLVLPLPQVLLDVFNNVNPGAAGVLLLLSAIWRSWKIGFLVLAGAAVMVIGPVSGLVPEVAGLPAWLVSLAAGSALAVVGFVFGRDT